MTGVWSAAARAYLLEHAIRPEVAAARGVREGGGALVWPTVDADGRPSPRRRLLDGDGPKVLGERGRTLGVSWVIGRCPEPGRVVVLCEGEADALAVESALVTADEAAREIVLGAVAVASVPSTGFPLNRLTAAVAAAESLEVAVAFDGDEAGRAAGDAAVEALRAARLRAYTLPLPDGRDLADCLVDAADGPEWLANNLVDASAAEDERLAAERGGGFEVVDESERAEGGGDVYPLLGLDDLDRLPEPSWLMDGLLPGGGLSVLYGPSGIGKSFVALDWGLSIAAGVAWYDRTVEPGWVLYIAAEGIGGLRARTAAWRAARKIETVERFRVLPVAANLLEGDSVERTRRTLASLPEEPVLVVIDTMARTMVGGDENAARDVGRFVANVDALRADSGAAALVIHHTGWDADHERGSTALRGAADAVLRLAPEGSALELRSEKAKDSEPFEPWDLHLLPLGDSCVLARGTDPSRMAPSELAILRGVSEAFGTEEAPTSKVLDASGVPKSSFYRSLRALCRRGFLDEEGDGRAKRYCLTAAGAEALARC